VHLFLGIELLSETNEHLNPLNSTFLHCNSKNTTYHRDINIFFNEINYLEATSKAKKALKPFYIKHLAHALKVSYEGKKYFSHPATKPASREECLINRGRLRAGQIPR
jgi:hypothetical protein